MKTTRPVYRQKMNGLNFCWSLVTPRNGSQKTIDCHHAAIASDASALIQKPWAAMQRITESLRVCIRTWTPARVRSEME